MLFSAPVWGQDLAPPPGLEALTGTADATHASAEIDPEELEARLKALRLQRADLIARRDELLERERRLAAGEAPALAEQLQEITLQERQAREVYDQAKQMQIREKLLEAAVEDLAKAPPLEVDPQQVDIRIDTATARRQLNVRAAPDVDSESIVSLEEGEMVVVLGSYQDGQWWLVDARGRLGFLRESELNIP